MSIDAMTALGMKSDETLEKKLKVWKCDEYTWVLAANKDDADKAYIEYMQDCHGESIVAVEVASPEEFTLLGLDAMRDAIFYPNDQEDQTRTFLVEYDHQIAIDPVTPRLFAVGE